MGMKYGWSSWTCLSMGPTGPYLSCIPQRRLALLQLLLQMVDRPSPFGTGTTVSSIPHGTQVNVLLNNHRKTTGKIQSHS